ncbi:MAG TPA: neutral zinc metallopeptidase [Chitinophagaceae bacterium]|nr:neutral zinc metallopeptidase [Chitinophagaceae bacterium]
MQWLGRRESSNVDDRRGVSGGPLAVGGGIVGVIFLLAKFLLGGGEVSDLQQVFPQGQQQEMTQEQKAADEEWAKFAKVILADTEDVWDKLFGEMGKQYQKPTLVLFSGGTQSDCGGATSQSGPFYCPADSKVYIDLSFAQDLKDRFGASGDFPMAYVIAHEVGHHVQHLLGLSDKMERLRSQVSETEYNKYSVKLELQADFYAGVWAHYDQKIQAGRIDQHDIEEALNAASAIGDDNITKGRVSPDAFTHGTSAQRMYWFKKGFETGDIKQGNTFEASEL